MNKRALVEAALFLSETPLSLRRLSRISGIRERELKKILDSMKKELNSEEHGIELIESEEGYYLQVKDEYLGKVADLASHTDIPRGPLRTLSIVALKQPILQSEIVKIQGNKAYGYIKYLESKGLIRTEKSGKTRLVRTTKEFERYFGKSLKEIQERLREVYQEDLNRLEK